MTVGKKVYIVCVDYWYIEYEYEFELKEKALEAFSFFVSQNYAVQFYTVDIS